MVATHETRQRLQVLKSYSLLQNRMAIAQIKFSVYLQADGAVHRHVGEDCWGCDAFPVPLCGDLHPVCLQLLDHVRRSVCGSRLVCW